MGRGQPTKCTPELLRGVLARIHKGTVPDVAAVAEGVDEKSHRNWMSWGEEAYYEALSGQEIGPNREPFYNYFRDVTRARAEWESRTVGHLSESEDDRGSRGKMFLLERLVPERYKTQLWIEARDGAAKAIGQFLSQELDSDTYARVVAALNRFSSSDADNGD